MIKFGLAAIVLFLSFSAEAQQLARVPKIGWLAARPPSAGGPNNSDQSSVTSDMLTVNILRSFESLMISSSAACTG